MTHMLTAVGVPQATIDMVPQIVETCRACRMWARPGPRAVATATLSTQFNERVQCDLLFFETYAVFNMLDEAIRWHAAVQVQEKDIFSLLTAFMTGWVQLYGPPTYLVVDGESSLASDEAGVMLDRQGTSRMLRAPKQHAQFVERRQ